MGADDDFTIIWTKQTQPPVGMQNSCTALPQQQQRAKKTARRKGCQDVPLIDTTAKLALRSKKTERLRHRQQKESKEVKSEIKCFLDLPFELLTEVFSFFLPSEIFALRRLNQFIRRFIDDNEHAIASRIIQRRYWVLVQCFPLPIPLSAVPLASQHALMSEPWQDLLKIHRNGYQHIQLINPRVVCMCMTCVLAWNNLNPLPTIPCGRMPRWNTKLLEMHASIVRAAMKSHLCYARILQTHLHSITRTIVWNSEWQRSKRVETPLHKTSSSSSSSPAAALKPRLYHLSDNDVAGETDEFLERYGPPSYQPIYMRDNYYTEEAFVPNRKWDKEGKSWKYYSKWPTPHQNDLVWLTARFAPPTV
ncbi:hypothetical protein DV736_g6076, partial [Chaetothyriales sp. CBS 134916]